MQKLISLALLLALGAAFVLVDCRQTAVKEQTAARTPASDPASAPPASEPAAAQIGRVSQPSASSQPSSATLPATRANQAAELRVDQYELAPQFNGTPAAADHQFVIVAVHWKNVLGTPYVIPDVRTQLQLIVNGESGATLVNDRFKVDGLLSAASQRIDPGKDVTGRYVFQAPAHATSIELAYFDTAYGNIRIRIAGAVPAEGGGAIAGPMSSGGFRLTVMSVDEADSIGETHAPAGTKFVVITATGQGDATIGDNYLDIDPAAISRVADADGHLYAPAALDGIDGVWTGPMRFIPATPQRGKLAFAVPVSHGALALSVAVPGQPAPMRLPLSQAAAAPPKLPPAVANVQDGTTAIFHVYGARRVQDLLVVDIGLENRTDSGIEFQTKEQILLVHGDDQLSATDEDLAASPKALPEGGVVPAHTLGRFDIPFRVPPAVSGLTLFYRGFEAEKNVPLPPIR